MCALLTLALIALFLPARADLGVNIMTYGEACNNVDGRITASGYGGVPPYSYAWTGPGGFTANTAYLSGLESGIYTLTLTDSQGGSVIMDAEVIDYPSLPYGSGGGYVMTEDVIGAYGYPCEGLCNAAMAMVDNDAAGTSPFEYGFTPGGEYLGTTGGGHPVYGGFCPGDYVEYMYVDANGCTGSGAFTVVEEYVDQMPTLSTIQGSCSGASDGSVLFLPGFYQSTYTLSQYGQVIQSAPNVSGNFLLDGLAPGVYSVSIVTEHIQCTHTEQFTIPDLGTGCGALTGSSWYDVNEDCVQDPGEVGLPLSVLSVEPGGYHAITHGDGSFHLALPDGNYTITQTDPTLVPFCPATQPVPFTMNSAPITMDFANGSTVPLDLRTWLAGSDHARPGFNYALSGIVRNPTPQVSGPVTVTLAYDPALILLNTTPTPTSVAGNVLTWEWPAFTYFESQHLFVSFDVPVSTPLGSVLSSTLSATNTLPEAITTNNTHTAWTTVTGSYDPNAKEVVTSSRSLPGEYLIGTDEYLDYTIQFQNTGTDTAFTVMITDTLSADLNMASFEQGPSSHPCTVDFKTGRVVQWTFSNILLADSNTNEAASHGLTSFRIRLSEPVLPGTSIENIANIYFDYNAPVITDPCVVETTLGAGITEQGNVPELLLTPNPTNGMLLVQLSDARYQGGILHVRSLDGRLAKQQRMPVVRTTIDVSDLRAGAYWIELIGTDGQVAGTKLLKY
jgi:uncharacterized repeat protein (TIGR01451 family)